MYSGERIAPFYCARFQLSFSDARRFNNLSPNSQGSDAVRKDSAGIRTAHSTVPEPYSRELLPCATPLRCLRPLSQLALRSALQSAKLRTSSAHRVNPVGKFFSAIPVFTDLFFLRDSFGAGFPRIGIESQLGKREKQCQCNRKSKKLST